MSYIDRLRLRKPGAHGKGMMQICFQVKKADNLLRLFPYQLECLKQLKKLDPVTTMISMPNQIGRATILRELSKIRPLIVAPLEMPKDLVSSFQSIDRTKRERQTQKWNIVPVDFDKLELKATANALNPERDQWGQPIWPPEVQLVNGRHPLAGEYNGLCFRTACQRPDAIWWNRGSHKYYCEDCAHMLNRENSRFGEKWKDGRPMCVKRESPEDESVFSHMV